jgi:hypothetical protein
MPNRKSPTEKIKALPAEQRIEVEDFVDFIASPEVDTMQEPPIYRSADLPDRSGRIVLYDWWTNPEYRFQNLVCLDGAPIWKAALPQNTGPDCFVHFTLDGNKVHAYTSSGYLLSLDTKTGETLTCIFVK